MNVRQAGLLLVPVLAAVAGCSAQAASPPPAAPAARANPTVTSAPPPAAPKVIHGNITVGTAASRLAPGPFRIMPLHCGHFSQALRDRLGTTAHGGLTYRFTNVSQTLTGAPNLSVNFTTGSNVRGSNVTGDITSIGPGQSGLGEVDAVGDSGENLSFTGCELMGYGVVSDAGGGLPGTYAP